MKQHFLAGFIKAAVAAGVPEEQIPELVEAQGLDQEAPMQQGGGEDMSPEELEQLIEQLSPEEVEQLVAQLEGPAAEPQLHELAEAIEGQVGANPQVAEALAPQEGAPQEVLDKQSAIKFIKSASYVEGFLEQAISRGADLKTAVDLYDQAFSSTFNQLKISELKGDQHKLDVDKDGKIEGEDLKKLRATEDKTEDKVEEKTAAYYEGVLEQARSLGFTDDEALDIVKSAANSAQRRKARRAAARAQGASAQGASAQSTPSAAAPQLEPIPGYSSKGVSKGIHRGPLASATRFIRRNPIATTLGAAGLGAAGAGLAASGKKKEE